jgi:hypothetical protein
VLLLLAVGVVLWRRSRFGATFVVWSALCFLATNPRLLGLPGDGAITNFTLLVAAYLPASVLIGALAPAAHSFGRNALLFCLCMVVAAWGAAQRVGDIAPEQHALVTQADLRAATWLRQNTQPAARIWVNAFPAYGNVFVVGSDAGWWLPLLAQRSTTLPPLLYGTEKVPYSGYIDDVNALPKTLIDKGIAGLDLAVTLQQRGITHVYIGQRDGSVNWDGTRLDAAALLQTGLFRVAYHEDRVWVLERLGADGAQSAGQ